MRSDRRRGLAVMLVCLGGCEIEKVSIPPTESKLAVHAVLSATAPTQVVLLERTRNGTVFVASSDFGDEEAVAEDEGVGETDALVTIATPDGDVLVGIEDKVVRGAGEGIYRFYVPGDLLLRGLPYRLHVRARDGTELSAETTLPQGEPAGAATARSFDRSRDTVQLGWSATVGARSYYVRVETPYGPRAFFTQGTSARLPGGLRNTDVISLPHVFIPGFPQAVTVSAVDSNFYDWFRGHANEVTGAGLVSRVQGGLGVFGALVRLRYEDLDVVAPQTEAFAGSFAYVGPPEQAAGTPYLGMELYLESKAARSDQADAVSGRVHVRPRFGYTGCLTCGVLGTVRNGRVELGLLGGWSARDTAEVFTGEVRGDTIVGSYRFAGGPVRFVKQR